MFVAQVNVGAVQKVRGYLGERPFFAPLTIVDKKLPTDLQQ